MVLLRIVVVVVISEIDVARFIPILCKPISPAVRDLDVHGAVKGIMFPFAIGQLVDFQSQRNSLNGPRVSAASATRK